MFAPCLQGLQVCSRLAYKAYKYVRALLTRLTSMFAPCLQGLQVCSRLAYKYLKSTMARKHNTNIPVLGREELAALVAPLPRVKELEALGVRQSSAVAQRT
jgi:hypothetical protein